MWGWVEVVIEEQVDCGGYNKYLLSSLDSIGGFANPFRVTMHSLPSADRQQLISMNTRATYLLFYLSLRIYSIFSISSLTEGQAILPSYPGPLFFL